MKVILDLPEELAHDLTRRKRQSAAIVSAGLREVKATGRKQFNGLTSILEKLAALPAPREVLALHASRPLEKRIEELLEKNRNEGLTRQEQEEWSRYELVEHLVRIAKGNALAQLADASQKCAAGTSRRRFASLCGGERASDANTVWCLRLGCS